MSKVAFYPELKFLLACVRGALGTAPWPTGSAPETDLSSPEPKTQLPVTNQTAHPQVSSVLAQGAGDRSLSSQLSALNRNVPAQLSTEWSWPVFLRDVERHRLAAFLHANRPNSGAAPWPIEVGERLEQSAQLTLRRGIAQTAESFRLVQLLERNGIETLLVKGPVLAQQLYGGIGKRHAGDIDLLIAPEDVERADGLLRGAGLRRTRPDFELTPKQTRAYRQLKPEYEYVSGAPPQRVELLWRADAVPDFAALRARAVTVRLGSQEVRTLPPELNALYLFQHGARHGWFRLFWLVDVARVLHAREPIDWASVLVDARKADAERALRQGSALAAELLGTPLPAPLQPPAHASRELAALVGHAKREIANPTPERVPTAVWVRRTAYRTRLQRTLREKYRVLAPHLFSPQTWRSLRLPDRWFFVYWLATPFLWLGRRWRLDRADAG